MKVEKKLSVFSKGRDPVLIKTFDRRSLNTMNRKQQLVIAILLTAFSLSILVAFNVPSAKSQSSPQNIPVQLPQPTGPWRSTSYNGYSYVMSTAYYTLYAKSNSNWGDGLLFQVNCTDGTTQSIIYQSSDYSYRDVYGSQDYLSSIASVNGAPVSSGMTYNGVYPNVNLIYTTTADELKENYVIGALDGTPASYLTAPVTLDFGGYIKYGSLGLYVKGVNETSSNFVTNSSIDFVYKGQTLFYLPAPTATDSAGHSVACEYEVDNQSGQIWFYTRTPWSFLQNAIYPVTVDPTINTGNLGSFVMPNSGSVVDFNAYFGAGEFGGESIAIEDAGGSTLWSYQTPFSGWTAISDETLITTPISGGSPTSLTLTGGTTYQLVAQGLYYPGNYYGAESASIDYTPTYYQVTFSASGLDSTAQSTVVTVNGVNYGYSSLPVSIAVLSGSQVTFNYQSVVGSSTSGKQFAITSLSQTSPITVTGNTAISASYQTQYYVSVISSQGTPTQSSQWVNSGSSFSTSVTTPYGTVAGQYQWVCSNPSQSIGSVTSAQTLTFNWQEQFWIQVNSAYGSPTQGSQWVNSGSSFSTSVTSPQNVVAGNSQETCSPTTQSISSVTTYQTLTFSWTEQYYVTFTATGMIPSPSGTVVTVNGNPLQFGSLPYSFWVNAGGSVTFSYAATVAGSTGIRAALQSASASSPLTVNSAQTVTGTYSSQYYLTVTSTYGSPTGQGWYGASAEATFAVTSPAAGLAGTQYAFSSWAGSGTGSYSGSTVSDTVTMNNPITETASWTTQYQVSTSHDQYSSITASAWYNAGATPTITYSANSDHTLTNVMVDSNGTNLVATCPYNFTFPALAGPHSIAVSTSSVTYYVNASAYEGVIYPSGLVAVPGGTQATFTCSSDSGYVLSNFYINGSAAGLNVLSNNRYVFTPTGNTTLYLVCSQTPQQQGNRGSGSNNYGPSPTASFLVQAVGPGGQGQAVDESNLYLVIGTVSLVVVVGTMLYAKAAKRTVKHELGEWK